MFHEALVDSVPYEMLLLSSDTDKILMIVIYMLIKVKIITMLFMRILIQLIKLNNFDD